MPQTLRYLVGLKGGKALQEVQVYAGLVKNLTPSGLRIPKPLSCTSPGNNEDGANSRASIGKMKTHANDQKLFSFESQPRGSRSHHSLTHFYKNPSEVKSFPLKVAEIKQQQIYSQLG